MLDNCENLTGSCNIFVCIFFKICDKFEILISKSSAATMLRRGGKWYMYFIRNFFIFLAVKKFWKSVKIWRRYHHEFSGTLILEHGV